MAASCAVTASFFILLSGLCLYGHVSSTETTEATVPEEEMCQCSCVQAPLPETEEEKQKFIEETQEMIEEELVVETDSLSATVRKKESATDDRPSAQNLGYLGVVLLCLSGFIILALDANYLFQGIAALKTKLASTSN